MKEKYTEVNSEKEWYIHKFTEEELKVINQQLVDLLLKKAEIELKKQSAVKQFGNALSGLNADLNSALKKN